MTERPPRELSPENLKNLIDDINNFREEECKEYLGLVPHLLIRGSFRDNRDIIRIKTEYRHHSGDSDYIISANVSANGRSCPRVYVWEIKAPQCYVFEKRTANRAQPSLDLIQAETQLPSYYDDLKRDPETLSEEFGVSSSEDLCFGGIIIGCNRTKVRRETNPTEIDILFNRAIRCRNYLYEHAKGSIRLILWDEIHIYLSADRVQALSRGPETASPFETPRITSDTISVFGNE
jgi:hypothetical protein